MGKIFSFIIAALLTSGSTASQANFSAENCKQSLGERIRQGLPVLQRYIRTLVPITRVSEEDYVRLVTYFFDRGITSAESSKVLEALTVLEISGFKKVDLVTLGVNKRLMYKVLEKEFSQSTEGTP